MSNNLYSWNQEVAAYANVVCENLLASEQRISQINSSKCLSTGHQLLQK